jgi:UDP-2,3-diacylglucosamine pyrophosphatase LpxH
VFDALRAFIGSGGDVLVMPGNHDVDLFWPAVQQVLRRETRCDDERLQFSPGWRVQRRKVVLEHGNRFDGANAFLHAPPFVNYDDGLRLERCWGTYFMEAVYNELEDAARWIDKLHPTWMAALACVRHIGPRGISFGLAVRFLAFALRYGKELLLLKSILGGDDTGRPNASAVEMWLGDEWRASAAWEAALRIAPRDEAAIEKLPGTLGFSAERGFERSTSRQLANGSIQVAAFGHTHRPSCAAVGLGTLVNTGSWSPHCAMQQIDDWSYGGLQRAAAAAGTRYTYARIDLRGHRATVELLAELPANSQPLESPKAT